MIGRLNHVAIATNDAQAAAKIYRETLGAKVSEAVAQPEHGVTTIFVDLPNSKVELIEPLGADSSDREIPAEESGGRCPSHLLRSR